MPISRVFQVNQLVCGTEIVLDEAASHHIARVLRAKINDELILFNGTGGEYLGEIIRIDKKSVGVKIKNFQEKNTESPLNLSLAQGISRGEKMDYTIQKAVELGVKRIIPLFTEYCNVRLDEERRQKKFQHWQSIIISACEQSGRDRVPELLVPQNLPQWLDGLSPDLGLVLSPGAAKKLQEIPFKTPRDVVLLIGPEGGLSQNEIHLACQRGFFPLNLGPRILRTETAAVAALATLQCFLGDMTK